MHKRLSSSVIGGMVLGLISLVLIGLKVTDHLSGDPFEIADIMIFVLLFVAWMQLFTWGIDLKMQKDEMGKQIAYRSATISYNVAAIGLFVLWIIDRIVFMRKEDFGNVSLFAALCFVLVLNPLVQFFVARKYR
ncbi:hypothetical protein [Laceyella putida]|uniref:DUF2178 domain-containing protein n=1 Tax=Laceyella putida TaxID=110101 RepID=A0ABW2RFK3_9BACL